MRDRTVFASAMLIAGVVLTGLALVANEAFAILAGVVLMCLSAGTYLGIFTYIAKLFAFVYANHKK